MAADLQGGGTSPLAPPAASPRWLGYGKIYKFLFVGYNDKFSVNTKINKNDNLIDMIFIFFYASSYVTICGNLMPPFRKFTMQAGTGEKGALPLHPHCKMIQKSFWHIPITSQVHIKSLEAGSQKLFLLKYDLKYKGEPNG